MKRANLSIIGLITILIVSFSTTQHASAWDKKVSIQNTSPMDVRIRVFNAGQTQNVGGGQSKIWKLNLGDNPTFHVFDSQNEEIYAKEVGILSNPFRTYRLYWTGSQLTDKRPD